MNKENGPTEKTLQSRSVRIVENNVDACETKRNEDCKNIETEEKDEGLMNIKSIPVYGGSKKHICGSK